MHRNLDDTTDTTVDPVTTDITAPDYRRLFAVVTKVTGTGTNGDPPEIRYHNRSDTADEHYLHVGGGPIDGAPRDTTETVPFDPGRRNEIEDGDTLATLPLDSRTDNGHMSPAR